MNNMKRNRIAMTRMQESIFTISVVIMVVISIFMTWKYLDSIRIPESFENTISGDMIDVVSMSSGFIEACYKSNRNNGISGECYVLHITSTQDVQKSDLMEKISSDTSVPTESIRFSDSSKIFISKNQKTTYKIVFDGDKNTILLKKIS